MRKKKILIPVCLIAILIFMFSSVVLCMYNNSLGIHRGRILIADNGSYILVENSSAIVLSNPKDKEDIFSSLSDGDEVIVVLDGIEETYPARSGAYFVYKLNEGDISDIPENVIYSLTELGWIEDFSQKTTTFSLKFGTYGVSSYNSSTGKLVKTSHATHPEDYITEMFFDEETLTEIYKRLKELNIQSYPDYYDPINNPLSELKMYSTPSKTIVLSVSTNEWTKSVICEDIACYNTGYNETAQNFLDFCSYLQQLITSTEEWEALPEYEFFYD